MTEKKQKTKKVATKPKAAVKKLKVLKVKPKLVKKSSQEPVKKKKILAKPIVKLREVLRPQPEIKLEKPVITPVVEKPIEKPKPAQTVSSAIISEKPILQKESRFEVVIPKYKVKSKAHQHLKIKPMHVEIKEQPQVPVEPIQPKKEIKLQSVEIKFPVTAKELSVKIQVKPNDIISNLMKKGILVTINQTLEEDVAKAIAGDFGYELSKAPTLEEQLLKEHEDEDQSNLVSRSPVVTLMGHVDHGKTSLLDAIRKTNVAEREAGGITQHIGAYRVQTPKGAVTFLDTPGHEAFTAMRARGATATDIVILVVAADDGIMPQTVEAIDHAKAANVSIVVALNKIDKPTADPDRVKKQLNQLGLRPEEWGGKTIVVGVSAKTKQGIDTLLEMVLLEAEMLELKANMNKSANGVVIEGCLSRGRGPIATILVKNGTLKEGDNIVVGAYYGKIRSMINDKGEKISKVFPSMPVEISGLSGVPQAGDQFYVVEDEKKAKEIFQQKEDAVRHERPLSTTKKITLEEIYTQIKEGKIKELNLIIKTDVQGSLEALKESLSKMSTDEVKVNIIHSDVGIINDADIVLASASNAIIIGFNVAISPEADITIKKEGVDIRLYRIIYDITSDIKSAMEGLLEPRIDEVFEGRAVVKQVFKVTKVGTIAGCVVQKGAIGRTDSCKLIRGGKEIYKGKIISLKRFKDDVKEVKEGFECGIGISDFNDMLAGDIIEAFVIRKTARTL